MPSPMSHAAPVTSARSVLAAPSVPRRLVGLAGAFRRPLELKGTLSPADLDGRAVAIVGARAATAGGLAYAAELAERLARRGVLVVSGGALGIDGAAHGGALAGGGRTVAVLGTGVDVIYPERHAGLFARIEAMGALLSPYASDALPRPGTFPSRNPFIAALADAVVVVEASLRSGSLGTARAATDLARPLWSRAGTPGCDRLLLEGRARPAPAPAALVAALLGDEVPACLDTLSPTAQAVLAALTGGARRADEVAPRTGLSLSDVLAILMELELDRRVLRLASGGWLPLPGGPA